MVKAQKPKKESSSEASSSFKRSKPQNILFLSDKEKANLELLAREDNIANSMKAMGKLAIKASSTHTRVSDELAANEARYLQLQQEGERNRVRLEVLQEQADNRSDLEDQDLKDLSAWMQETKDLQSLIPQSDEDGSPLRPRTEEEEEINPLKRKRATTKSVPKHLRRKSYPTMITSRLLTTPLKRRKKNKPMTRKKRRTTTTTIPSINQTRKIRASRKRKILLLQNRKRKSLCL